METSIEDKKKALDNVWYELWMFAETYKRLPLIDHISNNIYLESFLMHLRNIVLFLEDRQYPTDIKISDFNLDKLQICLPVDNTCVEVNKKLSHLTWNRVYDGKTLWHFKEIKQEIDTKFSQFLDKISDKYFPTHGFKKTKDDFYSLVKETYNMTTKQIYPKDFITDTLIAKIREVIPISAYLSFSLICSGIEFLGKCLDANSRWEQEGLSKQQFTKAIAELFPKNYHNLADILYKELRCGLVHRCAPGSIILTQISGDREGKIKYMEHPHIKDSKTVLVIEYFYFDFAEACKKVLSMHFEPNDKMNAPYLIIGPLGI